LFLLATEFWDLSRKLVFLVSGLKIRTGNSLVPLTTPVTLKIIFCVQTMHKRKKEQMNYRKNSNTIRTILTKNRGLVAGVRIIHVN